MTDERFRELVGDELSSEERAELERIDRLLRSVPAPPAEVPSSLTRAVETIGSRRRAWTPRRAALAVALAAALAAVFFAVGRWTQGGPEYRATIPMQATSDAPHASALIRIGDRDDTSGNWRLELQVSGLPRLSGGDYYVLWLAKDGRYAATCGTFNVGKGTTTVDMTVSYRLDDYDAWVVSRREDNASWLLRAPT
jgi:hypothetical protein